MARENSDFGASLRAGVTEAALVIFEINARIAARAALQNVVFTSINTGVATGAMGQKMRFITEQVDGYRYWLCASDQ